MSHQDSEGRPTGPLGSVGAFYRRARFGRWFGWHLVAVLAVFFASAFAGYAVVGAIPFDQVSEFGAGSSPFPNVEFTVPSIMFNNLRVLLLIGLGVFTAGLLALFAMVINGLLVGAVVALVLPETGWNVVLAALLPHGIVELSAFFVAAAVAVRVPHRVVRYLLGWDDRPLTRVEAYEIVVLGLVTTVMIVVAAWIEVTVTPAVVEAVGGGEILSQ